MSLLEILTTLVKDDISAGERNSACERLLANLKGWGAGYLRTRYKGKMGDSVVDDAFQHLLMQAAMGSSRFRGASEGEAKNWCKIVMFRFITDQYRNWQKRVDSQSDDVFGDIISNAGSTHEMTASPNDVELKESITCILADIKIEIEKGHREDASKTLVRSFNCHLAGRFGATLEEQVERWGFEEDAPTEYKDAETLKKARDRVYQYRTRGRVAGCTALSTLATKDKYTEEEIALMRSCLGCNEGV